MKGWDECEGGRRVKKGGDEVERSRVWRIDGGDGRSMVKGRNGEESRERTMLKRIRLYGCSSEGEEGGGHSPCYSGPLSNSSGAHIA